MMKKLPALLLISVFLLFALSGKSNAKPRGFMDLHAVVTLQTGGGHSVVLTWTQSPNPACTPTPCPVTGNQVFRGTTAGGEGATPLITFTTPTTTYTDSAVTNGVTYFYYVTAVNVNGPSPKSSEVSVTIPNQMVPNAPTGLTGVVQ